MLPQGRTDWDYFPYEQVPQPIPNLNRVESQDIILHGIIFKLENQYVAMLVYANGLSIKSKDP